MARRRQYDMDRYVPHPKPRLSQRERALRVRARRLKRYEEAVSRGFCSRCPVSTSRERPGPLSEVDYAARWDAARK